MLPDRVAGCDDRQLDPLAVLDPKGLTRSCLVRRILKNQDGQQAIGLARNYFVSFSSFDGVVLQKIKTDDSCASPFHQRPGARGLLRKQFPTVRAFAAEVVWKIISSAPFDEGVVRRPRGQRIVDSLRAQLGQMSETARPAVRDLSAVRIAPITLALAAPEEVPFEPLHVVAVGANKAHCAPAITP